MTVSNVAESTITTETMSKIAFTKYSLMEDLSQNTSIREDELDDLCTGLAYFMNTAPKAELMKLAKKMRNMALHNTNN